MTVNSAAGAAYGGRREEVKYDLAKHGDSIEAEVGDDIYVYTDIAQREVDDDQG